MVQGTYFDGQISTCHEATLSRGPDEWVIHFENGMSRIFPVASTLLRSPLGRIPLKLEFFDGGVFEGECSQSNVFSSSNEWTALRRWTELRWSATGLAVTAIVLWFAVGYQFVIPILIHRLVAYVPDSVVYQISSETRKGMQSSQLVSVSELSDASVERVKKVASRLGATFTDQKITLHFCKGIRMGTNAFVLPDGSLYLTDQIVELLKDDDELLAVLLHETGHVAEKHGLQSLVGSAGLAFLFEMISQENSLLALPESLITSGYSRKFEFQADQFSAAHLEKLGISFRVLGDALKKIADEGGEPSQEFDLFSSHPSIDERMRRLGLEAVR